MRLDINRSFPLSPKPPNIDCVSDDFPMIPVMTMERAERAAKYADKLFHSGILDISVCFACAMTSKGRDRIRRYSQDKTGMYPETGSQKSLPEIQRFAQSMHELLGKESPDKETRPDKTMQIVRAAYPRIYNECLVIKGHGPHEQGYFSHTYFKLLRIDFSAGVPENDKMNSEGYYLLAVMLWIFQYEKRPLIGYDILLAQVMRRTLENRKSLARLDRVYLDYKEDVQPRKKQIEEYDSIAKGKEIPCSQVVEGKSYNEGVIQRFTRFYAIMDQPLDLYQVLEATNLTRKEYLRLSKMALDTHEPLSRLTVPYSLLKQHRLQEEYLEAHNKQLIKDLHSARERLEAIVQSDEKVAALEERNTELESQFKRLNDELSSAHSRERGLKSDLAKTTRLLREKDKIIEGHTLDRAELVELRESLYELSQGSGDE